MLGLETSDGRMSRLARGCLALGRPVGMDEILASLDAVTADDVARVADRIGSAPGRCLAVLGDVDEAQVGLA